MALEQECHKDGIPIAQVGPVDTQPGRLVCDEFVLQRGKLRVIAPLHPVPVKSQAQLFALDVQLITGVVVAHALTFFREAEISLKTEAANCHAFTEKAGWIGRL